MTAQGVNIAEEMHVIPALYSVSGTSTTNIWNMQNAAHAAVTLNQVSGSALTVTVERLTGVKNFFRSTTITFPVLLAYLDPGGNGMRAFEE